MKRLDFDYKTERYVCLAENVLSRSRNRVNLISFAVETITLDAPAPLLRGYRRFRTGSYRQHAERYASLGDGQHPDSLVIACCDSRADPAQIFDAAPGELFVVRNVANLVPPYEIGGGLHGVSAALEFAITALKVRHVVVMGHGGCGGVAASLSAADDQPVGTFIAPWVKLLDEPRDRVLAERPDDPQTALEHAGVATSLANLETFPFVREALQAGRLNLHGAWFAIASGKLQWLDPATGAFEAVTP